MGKKIKAFGNIEIETRKFHHLKIYLILIDIDSRYSRYYSKM